MHVQSDKKASVLLRDGSEKILNDLALVVHVIKSQRMEIVELVRSCVDLNSAKHGQTLLDASSTGSNNVLHEEVLRIEESIRKLVHPVIGTPKALAVGQDKLLDSSLLEIRKRLDLSRQRGSTVGNTLEVVGGGNGASTAVVQKLNTATLDLTDGSILGNANVGTIDHQTVSIIGNVGRHGAYLFVWNENKI